MRLPRWLIGGLLGLSSIGFACGDEPPPPPPPEDEEDGFFDPLSMPAEPTLSPESFNSSQSCQSCHPKHYDQWRSSMHAYAMVDPVFRALVAVRQQDYDGAQDPFCIQCHSAIATRGGEIEPGFSFDDLSPISLEGIGCESCHKISEIVRSYNAGHELSPDGPQRGPIEDPALAGANHDAETAAFFSESLFCASCHDVIEVSGLELERPYDEWLESPAFASGQTCQSCHMPESLGPAAEGGPERTLHDHRFIGVDVPLAEGFASEAEIAAIREGVVELLDGSATVEVSAPTSLTAGTQADVLVSVTNHIAGHNIPTGTTSIRELWVELIATDGEGKILYETGTLDDNGDLRHHFSDLDAYGDEDLLVFNTTLIDADGEPTVFPWRAVELRSTAIPPLYTRTFTLFVPTDDAAPGELTISARLRFRSHGPYLMRRLGLDALADKLEIYDLDDSVATVQLSAPRSR